MLEKLRRFQQWGALAMCVQIVVAALPAIQAPFQQFSLGTRLGTWMYGTTVILLAVGSFLALKRDAVVRASEQRNRDEAAGKRHTDALTAQEQSFEGVRTTMAANHAEAMASTKKQHEDAMTMQQQAYKLLEVLVAQAKKSSETKATPAIKRFGQDLGIQLATSVATSSASVPSSLPSVHLAGGLARLSGGDASFTVSSPISVGSTAINAVTNVTNVTYPSATKALEGVVLAYAHHRPTSMAATLNVASRVTAISSLIPDTGTVLVRSAIGTTALVNSGVTVHPNGTVTVSTGLGNTTEGETK